MAQVSVHDAKTNLSKLIAAALEGDEMVIARGRVPVVRLVPVAPRGRRCFGALKGKIAMRASTSRRPRTNSVGEFSLRLLLDTHVLIWWLAGDEGLSHRTREAIADETNSVAVSAASAAWRSPPSSGSATAATRLLLSPRLRGDHRRSGLCGAPRTRTAFAPQNSPPTPRKRPGDSPNAPRSGRRSPHYRLNCWNLIRFSGRRVRSVRSSGPGIPAGRNSRARR